MIDKRVQAAFSTYFYLLKQLFTVEDGFFREPDYDAFKKCFGENPQAHYLKVTGKKFDDAGNIFTLQYTIFILLQYIHVYLLQELES